MEKVRMFVIVTVQVVLEGSPPAGSQPGCQRRTLPSAGVAVSVTFCSAGKRANAGVQSGGQVSPGASTVPSPLSSSSSFSGEKTVNPVQVRPRAKQLRLTSLGPTRFCGLARSGERTLAAVLLASAAAAACYGCGRCVDRVRQPALEHDRAPRFPRGMLDGELVCFGAASRSETLTAAADASQSPERLRLQRVKPEKGALLLLAQLDDRVERP